MVAARAERENRPWLGRWTGVVTGRALLSQRSGEELSHPDHSVNEPPPAEYNACPLHPTRSH